MRKHTIDKTLPWLTEMTGGEELVLPDILELLG